MHAASEEAQLARKQLPYNNKDAMNIMQHKHRPMEHIGRCTLYINYILFHLKISITSLLNVYYA